MVAQGHTALEGLRCDMAMSLVTFLPGVSPMPDTARFQFVGEMSCEGSMNVNMEQACLSIGVFLLHLNRRAAVL